jgi:hypothetical protein
MRNNKNARLERLVKPVSTTSGISVLLLFVTVTGCDALNHSRPGRIDTEMSVGLIGSLAHLEFDKATGQLVHFTSIDDQAQLLKASAEKGNLFRVYYGVKQLEDVAIGGGQIDAGEFALKDYRFYDRKNKPALRLTYAVKKDDASLEATLNIVTTHSGAFDLALEVKNTADKRQTVMADFPCLSGITLSDDPASDLSIHMKYAGASGAPAWREMSRRYGDRWTFAFDIVYDKENTRSLGYMILDKKFGSKTFKRDADGGMRVFHLPAAVLEPGQGHTYPTARLMGLAGSWKVVAREYGNWMRANFEIPAQPLWYQETNDFRSHHLPDWTGHTGWKPYAMSAELRKTVFDRLKKEAYLGDEISVQEVHGWRNWSADGDDPHSVRPDLGGNEKLIKAAGQAHAIGRRLNSYFGASTNMFELVEPGKPKSYFELVNKDGSHFQAYPFEEHHPNFGFRQATICPGLGSWRAWLLTQLDLVMSYGFDGFRLDEQPFLLDCFNPEHHHENPYDGSYRVAELMRIVREHFDETRPGTLIMSEWGTDFQVPYINSVMIHSHAGFAVTPARVAFPELYWLPHYPLGAFEAALNGWVVLSDGVCTLGEGQNRDPQMPWPNKERFARLDDHGPKTKYRRLRSQFFDAFVTGATSDIDPYCPDDDFWRGVLFKSKDYYLLVGGYPDGTTLPGPRKIKIDYLPNNITSAYEIDAYTLEKNPAKIQRSGLDIFIAVKSGFSAVLLPKPSCQPKIEADVSEGKITLSLFAPWRNDLDTRKFKASVEVPGFKIKGPREVTLPTVVEYQKTAAVDEPGKYYFIVRGDQNLPYRGWFELK